MIKIFDCSNSSERPSHRIISKCPKENDMMKDLKKYCPEDFCFVDKPLYSDILLTNDVFPSFLNGLNKIRIKRMDGVFWQNEFKERNEPLNKSAIKSDLVIFISQFSKDSYFNLYGTPLKNNIVINNNADTNIFNNRNNKPKNKIVLCASASNWNRPEKRLNSILKFFDAVYSENVYLNLIGDVSGIKISNKNIKCFGYIENQTKMSEIMNESNLFINLSYKDACPKTVIQAIQCGLPVLYANSGGVKEMVGDFGFGVSDIVDYKFENKIPPEVCIEELVGGLNYIINNYNSLKQNVVPYDVTMKMYFDAFRKTFYENS